jgi:hypothetical protein
MNNNLNITIASEPKGELMQKLNNKIAFFGASITQQKTGYVHYFKELNPHFQISQFGYGSMYIQDAGICYIDDVISVSPDYCFLDWFSSACYRPPEKIKDYLDAIVQKLFSINCHPIFLFFYRKNMDNGWFTMFDYLKNYANTHNINVIDLSKIDNPDDNLRDSIHTNDLGSQYYATFINKQFHNMKFKNYTRNIQQNKFSNVLSIDINIIATEYIELNNCGLSSIIGILQKIGPYTDDVIYTSQNKSCLLKLKDEWSQRYERQTIKINIEDICGSVVIKIPEGKRLVWEKLFYIGDYIQLIDYK